MKFMISEKDVQETFEHAKDWVKKNLAAELAVYADEPKLEIVEINDGWDITYSVTERKIKVNLRRVEWYLWREEKFKIHPKYDLETALIHELYEYCYMRRWNYPETDKSIVGLVHARARLLENMVRHKKGLTPWL